MLEHILHSKLQTSYECLIKQTTKSLCEGQAASECYAVNPERVQAKHPLFCHWVGGSRCKVWGTLIIVIHYHIPKTARLFS